MAVCPGNPFEGNHPLQCRAAALYDAIYAAQSLASECGFMATGQPMVALRGQPIEQVSDADLTEFAKRTWREVEAVRERLQSLTKLLHDGQRNFERTWFIRWCVFGVGAVMFIWGVS